MKKLILIIAVLLLGTGVFAQKGEIIYVDFEPDSTMTFFGYYSPHWWGDELFFLDLDKDGTNEWLFFVDHPWGNFLDLNLYYNFLELGTGSGYDYPYESTSIGPIDNIVFPQYGDTLPCLSFDYSIKSYHWMNVMDPSDHYFEPHYLGVRKRVADGQYCYGWIEASVYFHSNTVGYTTTQTIDLTVYRTAYCTIPNYPLCVGQTSFDWVSTKENNTPMVNVYPNPGNDMVMINAPLENAVVRFYDLQGRLLLAKSFDFNTSINTAGWSQGIYLWEIWNGTQKAASGKWVKE